MIYYNFTKTSEGLIINDLHGKGAKQRACQSSREGWQPSPWVTYPSLVSGHIFSTAVIHHQDFIFGLVSIERTMLKHKIQAFNSPFRSVSSAISVLSLSGTISPMNLVFRPWHYLPSARYFHVPSFKILAS